MASTIRPHMVPGARRNGQTGEPIAEACQVPHYSTAHQVVETYREVSWLATMLKSYWHVLMIVVGLIFTAGAAWQKMDTSQAKIEAVAVRVQAHDGTLTEIKESVAIVRGILEGEQRRALVAGAPLAPQAAATSIRGRRAPLRPQRSIAWFNLH
jgi:hypothetical protein